MKLRETFLKFGPRPIQLIGALLVVVGLMGVSGNLSWTRLGNQAMASFAMWTGFALLVPGMLCMAGGYLFSERKWQDAAIFISTFVLFGTLFPLALRADSESFLSSIASIASSIILAFISFEAGKKSQA